MSLGRKILSTVVHNVVLVAWFYGILVGTQWLVRWLMSSGIIDTYLMRG